MGDAYKIMSVLSIAVNRMRRSERVANNHRLLRWEHIWRQSWTRGGTTSFHSNDIPFEIGQDLVHLSIESKWQRFIDLRVYISVRPICHCYGSFTGYASQNESGSGCVFWRTIVCMAQHRRTCLTACGWHQRSSLVDVSALLTPRHYKCGRLVGLPLATAPFRWLQRVHETVCH